MTPAARFAAAADILDEVFDGTPAERALTAWSRRSRFAGSKDRIAVRDHVYHGLRNRRSLAWLGGAGTGRGIMIGLCRQLGLPLEEVFTGDGHSPAPLSDGEGAANEGAMPPAVAADLPDWLFDPMQSSLGEDFGPVIEALRDRAPVFARVNLVRITREEAIVQLAEEGIEAAPASLSPTALRLGDGARKLANGPSYADGFVELQDAASQAICDLLPIEPGQTALDFCAGGGGKGLALAARGARVFAHDADPARMKDLPPRATRAGVSIPCLDDPAEKAPYDLVLCDVPCSGSGSWRRAPDGKWRLDPDGLAALNTVQEQILDDALPLVAEGGTLAYITCSVLRDENEAVVARFRERHPALRDLGTHRFLPGPEGDGFFLHLLGK
ncbi:16S rRNA (cytosine967-C5)-methyltransferase [Poseidonocella pacifica]|uniref:16S rRNA (Cytosine967-C5)-methyltransferase n=1 Tax=Poseidonocella pacifica TaxID=871651 RepID=A0A1I0VQF2_9RHOB|nr:RsmB/NOP family class I SAM-dependent RNA methyltransferase [Poseidonocella pacifica]SFA78287.1 16S rRNA (cytosine967-C5)-methyltransferase [Poseidonocella pacifica]